MGPECYHVWDQISEFASLRKFYLAGDTALALRLHHRTSTDLDFFLNASFDSEVLYADLNTLPFTLAIQQITDSTLNVLCDRVRVQFLACPGQTQLEPSEKVGHANVAAIPDILAMKLKALLDRGKLRDYFDLMMIDRSTSYSVELALYLSRIG